MMPELEAAWQERMSSSAWVIHGAYEEFKRGVDLMKSLKKVSVPGFPMRYHGNTEALTLISNGIMRDMRVFHIDDPNWIEMYNDQIVFETTKSEGWPMQSLETVIEEARQRQREKGWGNVRPALSTTVRAWIMRAVFDDNLRGEPQIAEEFLKRSLDLLEWGRQFWKNVPSSDRGAIFEDTFIRGVRSMHLETFMRVRPYHSAFPSCLCPHSAVAGVSQRSWARFEVPPGTVAGRSS
ncbi:hypothetical protein BV22DRAFT_77327 [Leucogyrophana mollusca]|uniref:Uncharacterized protein n=1 Tax=Leucogyrophana mollusca TaxID=85980 RepID=A0ACB8BXE6_9AGAM|nr:hypothetical protein BV22DRAFT_77327 [Leucogyrophana mollusca]